MIRKEKFPIVYGTSYVTVFLQEYGDDKKFFLFRHGQNHQMIFINVLEDFAWACYYASIMDFNIRSGLIGEEP